MLWSWCLEEISLSYLFTTIVGLLNFPSFYSLLGLPLSATYLKEWPYFLFLFLFYFVYFIIYLFFESQQSTTEYDFFKNNAGEGKSCWQRNIFQHLLLISILKNLNQQVLIVQSASWCLFPHEESEGWEKREFEPTGLFTSGRMASIHWLGQFWFILFVNQNDGLFTFLQCSTLINSHVAHIFWWFKIVDLLFYAVKSQNDLLHSLF